MAERVGLSNVVHRDCADRCNPDSIPTDGHGKPVFWAKYACTVTIWSSDTIADKWPKTTKYAAFGYLRGERQ